MQLKIFTWNMQRGGSIGKPRSATQKARYEARKEVLTALCEWGDIGFVTEPGNDLIGAVSAPNATSALLPSGYGFWNCSQKADGQKGSHDCKNLVFSKRILTTCEVNFKSGADDCYRWPAAGYFEDAGGPRVLLIALHATSGGAGAENSRALLDHLDESPGMRHRCHVALIGGDMNFNHMWFHMPKGNTHQSGSRLDGFMHNTYFGLEKFFVCSVSVPDVQTFGGEAKLVETGDAKGYFLRQGPTWTRMSDHAAVCSIANIEVPTFSIGKAPPPKASTSRRTRKPQPNTRYAKDFIGE
jgi:hypothetical protein